MSHSFKWFSALIILLFGIGTYVSITNHSLGPLPPPFGAPEIMQQNSEYQPFNWKDHGFSFDIPATWKFYSRDHVFVMADINEANADMIPNAIDEGVYRLQYSAYPEVAIFIYPELSLEERLETLNREGSDRECVLNQKGDFTQVDCSDLLPGGDHGFAQTRFYLFMVGQTLYELAIGDSALSLNPDQVDHIVNSIKFN